MTKDKRHLIWGNMNLEYSEWESDLKAEYPGLSEDELYEKMYWINEQYWEDEQINLRVELPRPILVIGDIGRWNGRVSGYKEISSGIISDCLFSDDDYIEWYVDEFGDLRADGIHHDGTNHYLYREIREDVTESQIEDLKSDLYYQIECWDKIEKYTRRIGDDIADRYGFDKNWEESKEV